MGPSEAGSDHVDSTGTEGAKTDGTSTEGTITESASTSTETTSTGNAATEGIGTTGVSTGSTGTEGMSTGSTGGDEPPTCVWNGSFDLDDDGAAWGSYLEHAPNPPWMEAIDGSTIDGPSADGHAIACRISGGSPYGNVHCYRNLPPVPDAHAFVLRTRFWYEPPTTFDDVGTPIVQALEFTTSKWQDETRWELALQWRNVGDGEPGWWYWNPDPGLPDQWVSTGIEQQTLSAQHWHSLELWGHATTDTTYYERFVIDGFEHPLGFEVPVLADPDPRIIEPDRLAVAVQVDGNAAEDQYTMVVDQLDLEWCTSNDCGAASTWYRDDDTDGFGTDTDAKVACEPPPGYVPQPGDCDDSDALMSPGGALALDYDALIPPLVIGTEPWALWMVDFVDPTQWVQFMASGSTLMLGDGGDALVIDYELLDDPGYDWVVARRELPDVDLSGSDFLLVPFMGTPGSSPRTLEIKLEDHQVQANNDNGCMTTVLLTEATTLPQWRTAVIAMERFAIPGGSNCGPGFITDLTSIDAVEIGISEVGGGQPTGGASGILALGPIRTATAEDLRLLTPAFECVPPRGDVMARIAERLVDEQEAHGFIRTWFPEIPSGPDTEYNLYTQAMALVVLSLEHERTGQAVHRDAAVTIASRLVEQQQPDGSWRDSYTVVGTDLVAGPVTWVGSHAWAMLGLRAFLDRVPGADPSVQASLDLAAIWLHDQQVLVGGGTGAVTSGTEGNVSSYFAFLACDQPVEAADVAARLDAEHWDAEDQWFWMGDDYAGIAIDVMCNWGAELLRREGRDMDALAACGLAAGIFPTRSFDGTVEGLGDIAGPWQPTVEFAAQYAHTGGPASASLMGSLLALEDPALPGAFPGSPADFPGGDGWNTSMTGIAPSAWVYLALHGPGFLRSL